MLHQRETTRDRVIAVIAEYAEANHNAPSTYQIAAMLGISQIRVRQCIDKLEAERRIERPDGRLKLIGAEYTPPA